MGQDSHSSTLSRAGAESKNPNWVLRCVKLRPEACWKACNVLTVAIPAFSERGTQSL